MSCIKKFNDSDAYTKYSILIIVLFSIIVLSLTSIYHVSGDGCWHVPVGKFIAKSNEFPLFEPLGRDEPFWSPPLYHIFVAVVYYIFSVFNNNIANFAVKFVSPVFGILSLIFSFLIIKKLFKSKMAFYSTLFLAFVPIFIDYSIFSYMESTLTFFVILSIYFAVNGKFVLSGIAAGLSILTKYNGIFILPVLIFILYKRFGKKVFYKNALIVLALSLLIASPWLARNWILLGNPIWPFLNFVFDGFQSKSYSALDLANAANPQLFISAYLGIFGVPDGNYKTFSFFNIPYLELLLAVWLIGTFIFLIPLITGIFNISNLKRKSHLNIFVVWILSYLILFFLYAINVGFFVSRMMLPAFPALAIFWAFGHERIKNTKFKKIIKLLIILISVGFILIEAVKISLAANAWDFYEQDFEWVRLNTKPNDVFIANGQCVPYNTERMSLFATQDNFEKADYAWVNQNFQLDKRSALDANSIKLLQSGKYKIVYFNDATGTKIYVLNQ